MSQSASTPQLSTQSTPQRSLSLFDVIALGINGVVGQGIFFVPAVAILASGPLAIVALIIGAVLCLLISLCFAEVGSRFQGTGGAYLYAREAFGDFVGFEVGWMTCLVAMTAWAALANGFVTAALAPLLEQRWDIHLSSLTITLAPILLMGALSAINILGAKWGAGLSTVLTVLKLTPLVLVIGFGLPELSTEAFQPFAPYGWDNFGQVTLKLLYAYVGFETLVVPAGEMKNPRRDVPIALITIMGLIALIYVAVFAVSIAVVDEIVPKSIPVSDAALELFGPIGGVMIAYGILCSVLGTNAAAAMVSPRRIFAFAEGGHLPQIFTRLHPRTGVPTYSIIALFVGASLISLSGSFKELMVLSVVARFCQYIPTCIATITLRSRGAAPFTLPGGVIIPVLTVVACLALLATCKISVLLKGGGGLVVGALIYLGNRERVKP
jgi:amino acid transporter